MAGMLKSTKATVSPEVHPGDIVRVHQKIKEGAKERIQVFEGIVIKTHGKSGANATFTVRKIAYGVGVEKTFPLQSPTIVKIEFKKSSEVHRAKLYYLRKLSGKSLKMKDKKIDRDIWELVAKVDAQPEELSEDVLEEAVKAEESKKQAETIVADHAEESSNDAEISTEAPAEVAPASIESEPAKDGTVEAEVDNGNAEAADTES